MKMFKAASFLSGLKVVSLIGAIAFSSSATAVAQSSADSQNFLNDLYSFLHGQDDLASELSHYLGDDLNVTIAQSFCQELANGRTTQSLYAEFNAGVISQMPSSDVYEQVDYATGLYIGSIMNLGSAYYCPQYQPQVVQALQSL